MLALLRGYKLLISPYFAGSCRFLPSCSEYARDAVLQHGALRGSWLAARRLARCHPLGSHGVDPVPTSHEALTEQIVVTSRRRERLERAAVGAGGGAPAQAK